MSEILVVLVKTLSKPVSVLDVMIWILLWFLWDAVFKRNLADNIIRNLLVGLVFIFLAAGGNLTIGLTFILIIPLSILGIILEMLVKKKGDGNN